MLLVYNSVSVMSGLSRLMPLFQTIDTLLTDNEIKSLLAVADKSTVAAFCEIAYNVSIVGSVKPSEQQKAQLVKFRKALTTIVDKRETCTKRRDILSNHPKLVRLLVSVYMEL